MGRLIDVDEVKKKYPLMENDFGMVINERLHKELDKIPTVEAISKADYDTRLKADMVAMLTEIQLEIEEVPKYCMTHDATCVYRKAEEYIYDINKVIQQKINELKESKDGNDN